MHLGPTGPVRVVEAGGETFYLSNDAAVLEPKAACSNTIEPSAAPEAESTAAALGPELPCAAASPAVIKPSSYAAAVSQSSVGLKLSAAATQSSAGPKLCAAASKLSADLKRSAAASEAAAVTSAVTKVRIAHAVRVACTYADSYVLHQLIRNLTGHCTLSSAQLFPFHCNLSSLLSSCVILS